MSESDPPSATVIRTDSYSGPQRPEELPPVEPPSAGHIVQLFLIPALIVAAVIGVWALFGRLAEAKTDWTQLVAELGSPNEHRRWRAAHELATVLRNEQIMREHAAKSASSRAGKKSPDDRPVRPAGLSDEPRVAEALIRLLNESLDSRSTLEDDIVHQEFLARTVGALNADQIVLPGLARAMSAEYNVEVRKSSLMSVAMIAGRHFEERTGIRSDPDAAQQPAGVAANLQEPLTIPTISNEKVWTQLKLAAQDEQPAIRHLTAFVFGLVSGDDAIAQLKLMLLDGDSKTRANAAVALARNGVADGAPILAEFLAEAATNQPIDLKSLSEEEKTEVLAWRHFEQPIILRNSIRAVGAIWDRISKDEQAAISKSLEALVEDYPNADVRHQAMELQTRNNPR